MYSWYNICKSIKMLQHMNKMKNENHMIISIDVEKAFYKIQHPFMKNTLSEVGIKRRYLNMRKAIGDQPTDNIILSWQKLSVSLKIMNKTGMSASPVIIQHSSRIPRHSIQTGERNKRHRNWKKKVKLPLFADK